MRPKENKSPLFKRKCKLCSILFLGAFLFLNKNTFAGSVIDTKTLSVTGYRVLPTTIPTAPLIVIGFRQKYDFKFKLPLTTDALEMTGVKSKKTKLPSDFSDIDEDMFAHLMNSMKEKQLPEDAKVVNQGM